MVLPLYAALDRLDRSLLEASLDLGAGHHVRSSLDRDASRHAGHRLRHHHHPVPSLGAYLTPDLLGGPDSQMIANVIERQFKIANDWPFGAALSFLLMYATFVAIARPGRVSQPRQDRRRSRDLGHGEQTPAPLDYNRDAGRCRPGCLPCCFFLYAPLVALMAFSFNDSKRNIVWRGFTLNYYAQAASTTQSLLIAFGNSLTIAADRDTLSPRASARSRRCCCGASLPGKAGRWKAPWPCRSLCRKSAWASPCWCSSPSVMPWPNDPALAAQSWRDHHRAHLVLFTFVALVSGARLASFNSEQEEAARDLGASDWRRFRDMLLPHMRPALDRGRPAGLHASASTTS